MNVFNHPFTGIIAGPTGSGKTVLLMKILDNASKYIYPPPDVIVYCYSRWQPLFDQKPFTFHRGLLDTNDLDETKNNLIILDDLMEKSSNDKSILNLFTVDSHHKNMSVFLITQNLFAQGKYSRSISLNAHYMILLNNPRDRAQINFLARQMFPTNSKFLIECYIDATNDTPHGYLFLDFKQSTPNDMRVQTGILSDDERIVYQIKDE